MIVQIITQGSTGDPEADALLLAAELATKAFSALSEVMARDDTETTRLGLAQVNLSQAQKAAMDLLKQRAGHAFG